MHLKREGGKGEKSIGDKVETAEVNDHLLNLPYPFQIKDVEKMDAKEVEKMKVEMEKDFFEKLQTLNEETMQLSELLKEEGRLIHELCTLLRQILAKLNVSLSIPAKSPPWPGGIKQALLNSQGHLIMVSGDGEISSRNLEDYPSDTVFMVFWYVIPQLGNLIGDYRKKTNLHVNFFNRITRELNNIPKLFSSLEGKPEVNPKADTKASFDSLNQNAISKIEGK